MATTEKEVFGIDLDAEQFKGQVGAVTHGLSQIGEIGEGSLKTLVAGFVKAGPIIAITGAAIWGLKIAFDKAFEGDQIEIATRQFDNLAEAAGLAGDKILEGMKVAAKGLVDDTDMIKTASKAIVTLGDNASRLPEIMDLARKQSILFGGTVAENFDQLSESLGAMRSKYFKTHGILVDATRAQIEFAKANRTTVDALTDTGKQQAFINAALEAAGEKYKNVKTNSDGVVTGVMKAKVAFQEIGDAIATITNKYLGPFFTSAIKGFASLTDSAREFLKEISGTETAQEKIKRIEHTIAELHVSIAKWSEKKKNMGMFGKFQGWDEQIDKDIAEEKAKINAYAEELKTLKKGVVDESKKKDEEKTTTKPKGAGSVDYDKQKEQELAFQGELLAIRKDANQKDLSLTMDRAEATRLMTEKMKIFEEDYARKVQEINNKADQGKIESSQRDEALMQLKRSHAAEEKIIAQEVEDAKRKADENAEKYSKSSSDAMSASFRNAAKSATGDMKLYQAASKNAFSAFQTNASKALQAWGNGSKKASEAVKMFFLGALGDMSIKQGEFMMLDAFKTFPVINAPELAAGAGLIALGAALGASSSGGMKGGGEGGGSGFASTPVSGTGTDATAQQKKTLTMNIHGNYFETAETKRTLVDMMKSELDVTDYKVTTVS